jgi:hypothetical protein
MSRRRDEAKNLQAAIDALADGFEAFGLKLPKDAASVRMLSGAPALESQLSGLDVGKVGGFILGRVP